MSFYDILCSFTSHVYDVNDVLFFLVYPMSPFQLSLWKASRCNEKNQASEASTRAESGFSGLQGAALRILVVYVLYRFI